MSQHGCPERLSNRSKGFLEDGSSQPTMEVLVETLTGTAFEMTVSPSDTIFAIKSKIYRVEGIPVSQQHLLYNLKELEDSASLHELAISDGARLRLVLGLRGGPISTRRLPPPPPADAPWRDIERLLDHNRDESSTAVGGCKVTVLVFREGERVNMLRVRENDDGTYSPIDHAKYSSPLSRLCKTMSLPPAAGGASGGAGGGAAGGCGGAAVGGMTGGGSLAAGDDSLSTSVAENALTMGKMLELRRRMDSLSLRSRPHHRVEQPEVIQKTRSEESLNTSRTQLHSAFTHTHTYPRYSEAHDDYRALYEYSYNKYDFDCSFADRYTLLPPIGRAESSHAISPEERLKLSGSVLVKSRRDRPDRPERPDRAATDYGPLAVTESGSSWRSHFGSSSTLPPPPSSPPCAPACPSPPPRLPPRRPPPALCDALFSSSTSDLEKLKRNRILPALSRHRNREHLHLSDEGLSCGDEVGAVGGATRLEVGSERRMRRINNIAEQETAAIQQVEASPAVQYLPQQQQHNQPQQQQQQQPPLNSERKARLRCSLCNKRLSIATEHACRCGGRYCAPHRYSEVHGCHYDYKTTSTQQTQHLRVQAPKLPKI